MHKIRTRRQSKKELYDHFNDSDIDDVDELYLEEMEDDVEFSDYFFGSVDIDPLLIESSSDEDGDENENDLKSYSKYNITWKREPFTPNVIPFHRKSNLDCDPKDHLKSSLEYFKKYFSDELFEQFAAYTNTYAE